MPLNDQDREWINLTSERLVYQVVQGVLKEHITSCPHGIKLRLYRVVLVALGAGIGIGCGGGGIWTLVKLLGA